MKSIPFPSNSNYTLTISPDYPWGDASETDIIQVLESVKIEFENIFGDAFINSRSLVVSHHFRDNPECQAWNNQIYLVVEEKRWTQYAYQFSHEFCHFIIGRPVTSKLRWLEESLCEMASYFFMPRISIAWSKTPPYPNWMEYAPYFKTYCDEDKLKAPQIELHNQILLNYLEAECENRMINKYIACQLLPIFSEYPDLWNIILNLPDIPANLSLYDSMLYWKSLLNNTYEKWFDIILKIFYN